MYSLAFIAHISKRLQEIRNNFDKPFGGINVILAGDMGQIKPSNNGEHSIMFQN